jgi:hypothetical protein
MSEATAEIRPKRNAPVEQYGPAANAREQGQRRRPRNDLKARKADENL